MRRIVFLALAVIFFNEISAQTLLISGTIQDQQAKTPLYNATVRLRSTTDSTFFRSTLTDTSGRFIFSNLVADSFELTASFVGYNEIRRGIKLDTTSLNLDIAATSGSTSQLATVVITANVAPVTQKGDTLQISANQFKVNPDATAEDLMRKVPGVTIENGEVKAQGETVRRVTIDGRELFGDDATAALRNLPAEIIDKIQIFDRLSDQAQLTGFDDGNTTRGINIVTRANMRNGQFGRVYAGYGTDNRYQLGGNSTILKDNRRISVVVNFNNINQQNFSQQDLLGVTSNPQRGGQGGGGNRGPGGPGGGNRGPGGGGNFGGWGNDNNFLVGQQNGINRTNAFGINYSDIWGKKITATGSYFFNKTNNTTYQLANTQYLAPRTITSSLDTTSSESRNINHRLNMRIEYRIDSSNTLIITPNLSFQDNESERRLGTQRFFTSGSQYNRSFNLNNNNSARTGNNLNNNILYRHSFPKRGRSFSINLNTSFNSRDGENYINTFQRSYRTASFDDTASSRFTDQFNNGKQISTNLAYTEPLSDKSQLQFSYNPSISKSESDQTTFEFDPLTNKYSGFLERLSNKFENKTTAHNGGVTYRWGDRDRQISFGVNYQNTLLESEQIYPNRLNVNKSFSNFLPNAMVRYKLSNRSNIRLFYRSNVNQPSVTQLQNVLDVNNRPLYSIGNPQLNQQFSNIVSSQYTYTNTGKSLTIIGNLFYQNANNYIANGTFQPTRDSVISGEVLRFGDQLTKPVNLDGFSNLRSFLTFAIPLKFIKSNFNLNGGVTFSKLPGLINNVQNETKNTSYSLGTVIASNVSPNVDFTISYTANMNRVENNLVKARNDKFYQHVAGLQLNLLSKDGWFFQNDLNNQYFSGLSTAFNQNYFLWNMGAGKKLLKDRKGELKLSVFDLLKQNRSINRNVTDLVIEDVQNQVLQQYFMLTFTYNLRNFGTAAQRQQMRENRDNRQH